MLINSHSVMNRVGLFAHSTSDIGNIGAKLNISISVCQSCVVVTKWHAFNKLHSHVSSACHAWLQVLNRWPTGKVKRGYVIIICPMH